MNKLTKRFLFNFASAVKNYNLRINMMTDTGFIIEYYDEICEHG